MSTNVMDDVIKKCIDDIWDQYDTNQSGVLEKDQAKRFVKCTLTEFVGSAEINEVWNEAVFESTFKDFDIEENNQISKSEMMHFIKKVADM